MDADIYTPSDLCIMASTYQSEFNANKKNNRNKKQGSKEIKEDLFKFLKERFDVKKEQIVTSNCSRRINDYYTLCEDRFLLIKKINNPK